MSAEQGYREGYEAGYATGQADMTLARAALEAAFDQHAEDYAARRRDDLPDSAGCAATALSALRKGGWLIVSRTDVETLVEAAGDPDDVPADIALALDQACGYPTDGGGPCVRPEGHPFAYQDDTGCSLTVVPGD